MELKEVVAQRYAAKHFDGRPIPEDKIRELLELVRWAPSGCNMQPWRIKVVSDPAFAPASPIRGLLSKEYAKARFDTIDWNRNDASAHPGDPYPFQGETNPFTDLLREWKPNPPTAAAAPSDRAAMSGVIGHGWVSPPRAVLVIQCSARR